MKLITWNVNGIRAAGKTTFRPWFEEQAADIVCIQEAKATPEQVDEGLLHPQGYHSVWHPAQKLGYSGTVTYSKREPRDVILGIGDPAIDAEGRVLQTDHGDFWLLNCYFPNSQPERARIEFKVDFCRKLQAHAEKLRARGKTVVICGDFNIAHREIDLKNPKSNVDTAGFRPEERECMDRLLSAGWVDTFREFEKGPDHYTWWTYRQGARSRNVGWRIDYFVVNQEARERLAMAQHQPTVMGSDHCPVVLQLRE